MNEYQIFTNRAATYPGPIKMFFLLMKLFNRSLGNSRSVK